MRDLNRHRCCLTWVVLFLFWSPLSFSQARTVLRGGHVVDGTGAKAYLADLALEGDQITEVGTVSARPSDKVIDVTGKLVAPGFIDLHNHSTKGLLEQAEAPSQVSQGITTLLVGPDGGSPFPLGPYIGKIRRLGTAVNVGFLVGHGTVRSIVLGEDFKREATPEEVEAMKKLVALAMAEGALGVSSGLEYDPGFYSNTEELVQLAQVAGQSGGLYMSHIRDEEDGFLAALTEATEIGRRTGARVQVSHMKLGNTRVWGRSQQALGVLHKALQSGVDVAADVYPYTAWASGISILVPSREFDDVKAIAEGFEKVGGPSKVLVTRYAPNPEWEFKNLEEISDETGKSPIDLFREMMSNGGAGIVCESMNEDDIVQLYRDPLVMVASDGGIDSRHPRGAGTFPRVLAHYVREQSILTLEEAVRKMTSFPASRILLRDRGRIAPGARADLVVFDAAQVRDQSTFRQPATLAEGIVMTFVNGVLVWDGGKTTGSRPGRVLLRNQ